MSDRAKEDVWKWSDGSANTYHQFTRYPPYDCYNNQDCAYLIYYGRYYWYGNYGYWNDYYCWGRLPSICGQLGELTALFARELNCTVTIGREL